MVLQGAFSVIQWFWCYMTMSKKTCHLLPIFREGGWEWAFQGRHGIYLDLYSLLINPSYPLAKAMITGCPECAERPPSFVRRCVEYALFVFLYAPMLLYSVRRRMQYETLC